MVVKKNVTSKDAGVFSRLTEEKIKRSRVDISKEGRQLKSALMSTVIS